MTQEEYLRRCAERDAELKARGIALVVDDPLDADYFEETTMKPFREQVAQTIAEMQVKGLPLAQNYGVQLAVK